MWQARPERPQTQSVTRQRQTQPWAAEESTCMFNFCSIMPISVFVVLFGSWWVVFRSLGLESAGSILCWVALHVVCPPFGFLTPPHPRGPWPLFSLGAMVWQFAFVGNCVSQPLRCATIIFGTRPCLHHGIGSDLSHGCSKVLLVTRCCGLGALNCASVVRLISQSCSAQPCFAVARRSI